MEYIKVSNSPMQYVYTDTKGREWDVWLQARRSKTNAWAIRCRDEDLDYEDAYPTKSSALDQIKYICENEI